MNRTTFAHILRSAILDAWNTFLVGYATDRPYAFALIGGQCGNYLGFAVATEAGLQRVAAEYERIGYQYQGAEWETFDNLEKLSTWLRWANPDEGWQYGDFADHFHVQQALAQLVKSRELGEDANEMEEFCTDVLSTLQDEAAWESWSGRVVVGFTYGEDPRDFLRSATRASRYRLVKVLWSETFAQAEISGRIARPS